MTTLTGIKAISFDVDGTLWDFLAAMRRSLEAVLDELERLAPEAAARLDVETLVETRNRVQDELRGRVSDLVEIRREAFRRALSDVGRPDVSLASHLGDVYFRHRFDRTRLFDDVMPALEALAPRYTLGLISNGNSYPRHLGLEDVISFAVFAQDHGGVEKPDRRLFEIALERAGCLPHELVHVGDSLETDVADAEGFGGPAGDRDSVIGGTGHTGVERRGSTPVPAPS